MTITDDLNERYAIIAEGCKVSQDEAERLHKEMLRSMEVKPNHYEEKIAHIRELARLQNMKRKKPVNDMKLKSSGG